METPGGTARWLQGIGLIGLLLVGPLGCAHSVKAPAPLSQGIRATLDDVHVVAAGATRADLDAPPTRWSAAGKGAALLTVGLLGAGSGNGHAAVAAVFLSPVAAVVGATVGAAIAKPLPNRRELTAALERAVREDNDVSELVRRAAIRSSLGRIAGPRLGEFDRADVSLEIRVVELKLAQVTGTGLDHQDDPLFELQVAARVRLVRAHDRRALYTETFRYGSLRQNFAFWASDEAREFRTGLIFAAENIGTQIADAIVGPRD